MRGVGDGLIGEQFETAGLAQGLVAGLELLTLPGGDIEAQHDLGAVILGEAVFQAPSMRSAAAIQTLWVVSP